MAEGVQSGADYETGNSLNELLCTNTMFLKNKRGVIGSSHILLSNSKAITAIV